MAPFSTSSVQCGDFQNDYNFQSLQLLGKAFSAEEKAMEGTNSSAVDTGN